ncbi:hypothetical protein QTL95_28225 [Rhizobium sp. S152]|uniref:hypothetical protein n=1 Tax=Rhizobium sp. S152 TaxID=3055038 RepID=UPI0025A93395|nr:hypothetical protein [Rhizobium sp. S152]MDM9629775.1 hypothetical protein [Rhizobium sp. S152]
MADVADVNIGLLLEAAKRSFASVCEHDKPMENAMVGLDTLLRAVSHTPSIAKHYPAYAGDLLHLFFAATLVLGEVATRYIPRERLDLSMAAASALITGAPGDPLRDDRVLYAAALSHELAAAICRREIARRGDPVAREVAVHRAAGAIVPEHRLQ